MLNNSNTFAETSGVECGYSCFKRCECPMLAFSCEMWRELSAVAAAEKARYNSSKKTSTIKIHFAS